MKTATKSVAGVPGIEAIRSALTSKETTATELTEASLRRIAEADGTIHAFLQVDRAAALAQAAKIDAMAAKGEALPPLAGVPVGIKDVLTMDGFAGDGGVEDSGRLHAAVRRDGGEEAGGGGGGVAGQAELR